jgi:dihydrofolate reductase
MKTTVYVGTSLDGFIARKNGDIEWLTQFANTENFADYSEFMSRIDAVVIGRGTFEKVLTFPEWHYEKKVFVLSKTIAEIPKPAKGKVTILAMPPREILSFLECEGFSNIYVDGGQVIQSFLKEDLVDELIVATVPILLGNGIRLFGALENDIPFKHIQTVVAANGLVRSYYEK